MNPPYSNVGIDYRPHEPVLPAKLSGNFVFPYVFVFKKFIPSLNVITERGTFP